MRWLACTVLLVGCVRARATAVTPTDLERTNGGTNTHGAIARTAPSQVEVPPDEAPAAHAPSPVSIELGAMIALSGPHDAARVHLAPGVRIFGSRVDAPLWGVAAGVDFLGNRRGPGFALEGSVYAGSGGGTYPDTVETALDLFAGITMHARTSAIAIGPSVGLLAMPGGESVVMLGLGVRVTNEGK